MKDKNILVSIICITYNQAAYVQQTLDGFISQNTNFDFEVIIHDDASTDNTVKIIQEYCLKYPNIIKPIFQKENQFSKVGYGGIFRQMKKIAHGKYFAFCEGDDFWIDSFKLQKQVDILENDASVDLVFTNINYIFQSSGVCIPNFLTTGGRCVSTSFSDHLFNTHFLAPCTWVFRKEYLFVGKQLYRDASFAMALDVFAKGKVYFLNELTASYRCLDESASHSLKLSKRYDHLKGVMDIKKDYIQKYSYLVTRQQVKRFYKDWYGMCYLMYLAGDIGAVKEAKAYFRKHHSYLRYIFYSLPPNFVKTIIRIVYGKYLV